MSSQTDIANTYRLPADIADDLDGMQRKVEEFRSGATTEAHFKAFRVPQGVYEQRESGTYMLRLRLPGGEVLPHQMRALSDAAEQFGDGILHVTSRQGIQVHGVRLEHIHPALLSLFQAGLSSKGGGGNTVRNVTACTMAGVCPNEEFDVIPHNVALTEYVLPDPLSYQLPRKYKIAFSGCGNDCAGATINDMGFIAKTREGMPGFAVWAGGGMGAANRVGELLYEFIPSGDAPLVAEAVKRVFDKHGNRKNRNRARIRFLVEHVGFERFRQLVDEELKGIPEEGKPVPSVREIPLILRKGVEPIAPAEGYDSWRTASVRPQKQEGYFAVVIQIPLGNIASDSLRQLAEVVKNHGEGLLRALQTQNLLLRGLHETELPEVHRRLAGIGLADPQPPVLRDMVSCTGAATCRLGICLSRGLATATAAKLKRSNIGLSALGGLKIHISGCPNACGRHPIADIGLFGGARRIEGRLAPAYTVQLGGRVKEGETRLASQLQVVPGRAVPEFLMELLQEYEQSGCAPDFTAFLARGGVLKAKEIAERHKAIPRFEDDKNFYYDWGAGELFSLAGRGPGECGAGVFDLIEVDLKSAEAALSESKGYTASVLAARALLVTQGLQPEGDGDSLTLFRRHFIERGLIDRRFAPTVDEAVRSSQANDPPAAFTATISDATALVAAVRELYASMDSSLRFPKDKAATETPGIPNAAEAPAPNVGAEPASNVPEPVKADVVKDFRGVVCPLNYVKTNMALAPLRPGQVLQVILDEKGAQNVPDSVTKDGHKVLSVTRTGDAWSVVIQKQ